MMGKCMGDGGLGLPCPACKTFPKIFLNGSTGLKGLTIPLEKDEKHTIIQVGTHYRSAKLPKLPAPLTLLVSRAWQRQELHFKIFFVKIHENL